MRLPHLLSLWSICYAEEVKFNLLLTCLDVQVILFLFQTTLCRNICLFDSFYNLVCWQMQTHEIVKLSVELTQFFIFSKLLVHVAVSVLVEELALYLILLDVVQKLKQ